MDAQQHLTTTGSTSSEWTRALRVGTRLLALSGGLIVAWWLLAMFYEPAARLLAWVLVP